MEREEIEAMWERIKTLEENSLKVSKALAEQSLYSIYGLMSSRAAAGGHHKSFGEYMEPKAEAALQEITNAQSIDEVIQIIRKFTGDCVKFTGALSK
jgi:hypothetical protein